MFLAGVILTQEPSLVKQASIGRNFGGNVKPDQATGKSSITPSPTKATQFSSSPTTDMSYMFGMYLYNPAKQIIVHKC